jgi:endonuclease-3
LQQPCFSFEALRLQQRSEEPESFYPVHSEPGGKKKTVRKIELLLRKEYGVPPKREPTDPLDVLVQTILSQNTSDTNSHRAFERLRQRFDDWNAARLAPVRQIENAIRVGGLARTKAQRIKKILSQIHESYGKLSLHSLCRMKPEQASTTLGRFKGVGPKTVNCVLLFGCGMNVFPVDTHILRVSKRLGLIPDHTSLEHAHRLWTELLPTGLAYPLHLNLIEHGRRTCHAREPRCPRCCLRHICRYYLARSTAG